MSHSETRRFEVAEFPGTFRGTFLIPREQSWKRKIELKDAGSNDASLRSEGITGDECAVSYVKVSHVPRRVTGRKYRAKRSDTIAIFEKTRWAGSHARKADQFLAGLACIQRKIATQKPRFTLADSHADSGKLPNQLIERADMIQMRVCQENVSNGTTQTLRSGDDAGSAACQTCVNQCEAVVFLDQEGIDHAKASEANQAAGFLYVSHDACQEESVQINASTLQ